MELGIAINGHYIPPVTRNDELLQPAFEHHSFAPGPASCNKDFDRQVEQVCLKFLAHLWRHLSGPSPKDVSCPSVGKIHTSPSKHTGSVHQVEYSSLALERSPARKEALAPASQPFP
jgi:hypothetical protein